MRESSAHIRITHNNSNIYSLSTVNSSYSSSSSPLRSRFVSIVSCGFLLNFLLTFFWFKTDFKIYKKTERYRERKTITIKITKTKTKKKKPLLLPRVRESTENSVNLWYFQLKSNRLSRYRRMNARWCLYYPRNTEYTFSNRIRIRKLLSSGIWFPQRDVRSSESGTAPVSTFFWLMPHQQYTQKGLLL